MSNKKESAFKTLLTKMESEGFGACYVCLKMKGRVRFTNRFCHNCEEYFCDEHGSFRGKGKGYCIMHDSSLRKLADENLNSK